MKVLVEDLLLLARLDETRAARARAGRPGGAGRRRLQRRGRRRAGPAGHARRARAGRRAGRSAITCARRSPTSSATPCATRPPDAPIEVSARPARRDGRRRRCATTGAGLDDDALEHVFDRFWQADQARAGHGSRARAVDRRRHRPRARRHGDRGQRARRRRAASRSASRSAALGTADGDRLKAPRVRCADDRGGAGRRGPCHPARGRQGERGRPRADRGARRPPRPTGRRERRACRRAHGFGAWLLGGRRPATGRRWRCGVRRAVPAGVGARSAAVRAADAGRRRE